MQSEIFSAMIFCRRKKDKPRNWFLENGSKFLQELISDSNGVSNPIQFFSSDQILKATNEDCYVSGHTFFTWYKGVIENRPYTIKKYTSSRFKGEDLPEDHNDIVLSTRVSNHSGFVKLIGCCLEFASPVLVFENPEYGFLNSRGSVDRWDSTLLPWNVRLKIAREVAIAITYLHTAFPRIIIHRAINPMNIFLDKNWNAKVTGFYLSVTLPVGKLWIKDKVMGTKGYLDPIYETTGFVTEYIDVFSFGIFMLVLLMGRPVFMYVSSEVPVYIFEYVNDLLERGEPIEFGDGSNNKKPGQMKMFFELAMRCCGERNEDRPKMIMVAKEIKLIERSLDC